MIKKGDYVVHRYGSSIRHTYVRKVSRMTNDGKKICVGAPIDGTLWIPTDRFRLAEPDEIKNKKRRDA